MDRFEFGEYRAVALLGENGAGRAYLARAGSGPLVVVKTLDPGLPDEPALRERLRHEGRAARTVHGPFTAAVLDAGPDAEPPWLAAEYCAGPSVSEAVAGLGPLASDDLAALGAALALALTAIHTAGLVHRGLKPANVLVTREGPRVLDFGRPAPGHGELVGSPGFLAPEQITYATEPAAPCDVFALGALLVLAATGRNPHGAGTAPKIVHRTLHEQPDLVGLPDAEWAGFLALCLAKEPGARPTVPDVLAWCGARAADRPWWRGPDAGALIDTHEESVRQRIAEAQEEAEAARTGTPIKTYWGQ
ncbi:protein kinase [Streptomyces sp. NPDC050264]|uniref:protein kinase domain-containing protein n=1 Tax=Streptomyces sp. NPDC050264 TaxID=3155038 RepID=UPI003414A598